MLNGTSIGSWLFPSANAADFDEPAPQRVWFKASLVAAAAFLICMALADRRGLWLDEFFTLQAARMDMTAMATERLDAGHSPVYFAYARLGRFAGESNYALRSTSALMAALNVLMLTGLALALGLRRILPALWLVALILPYWIAIGTEYRYTMFLTAAATGMFWLAARYVERPDWRRGMALALATTAAAWIHASAHILIVLVGVYVLAGALADRKSVLTVWPIAIGWCPAIPFLIRIAGHHSVTNEPMPHFIGIVFNMFQAVLGDVASMTERVGSARIAVFWLAGAVVIFSIAFSRGVLIAANRRPAWRFFSILLAGMPLIFLIFCIGFKNHQGPVRYLAAYAVPCSFCLAIYLHALWSKPRSRPLAIACASILFAQFLIIGLGRGDMLRESMRWILAQRRPQDPVVVSLIRLPRRHIMNEGVTDQSFLLGFNVNERDKADMAGKIERAAAKSTRGFAVLYHTRAPIRETLKDLSKKKFIYKWRQRRVSNSVVLIAWIRVPEDREWLKHLRWPH